ncbi:hypothetical protein JXA88_13905 [Candidatus Fermentibacteria bacterium]|nr:hypothetical protein [Candidatus Fermentibacteria bacterium]
MGVRHILRHIQWFAVLTPFFLLGCSDSSSPPGDDVIPADMAGFWMGTWHSSGGSDSGPFYLQAEQNGSNVSGTITIPDIDMADAPVTGRVDGHSITFGDIDQKIAFTGTIDEGDTTASGTYENTALNDNGTWQAAKGGALVALVDSFPLPEGFPKDLTWDGARVCILMDQGIWSLDPITGLSVTHPNPGQYPSGIAFDGTNLLVGDNWWGTGKIYRVAPGETSIFHSPGSGQITGLAFDGTHFWCADGFYGQPWLFKVSTHGTHIDSIRCQGAGLGGLTFDGNTLWYASWDQGETRIFQCTPEGQTLTSFPAPGSSTSMGSGLAFGDGHLWYSDGVTDLIYRVDTAGQMVTSFAAPGHAPADLTFDGTHLWVADGDVDPDPDRLYKLDTTGAVISQFDCPGSSPGGLTHDGTHLWLADKVTERVYRLPTSGDYFIPYPDFDIGYLAGDAQSLWGTDGSERMIRRFSSPEGIAASFAYPCDEVGGLAHDGSDLWAAARSWLALEALHRLDASGAIVNTYRPLAILPEPCGIALAGDDVWMIGRLPFTMDHKLYRLRIQAMASLGRQARSTR